MIKVKMEKSARKTERLFGEFSDRLDWVVDSMPRVMAEAVLEEAKTHLPNTPEYKTYIDNLAVFEVVGASSEWSSYAIAPRSKSVTLQVIDTPRTVLYIQPRLKGDRLSEAAAVLQRHEPWTVNTLPYEPDSHEVTIVARRVSTREVDTIERHQAMNRNQVYAELRAVGVVPSPTGLVSQKVEVDFAFFALRAEFGMPGYVHTPHWRPALRAVKMDMQNINKRVVERTLSDPDYYGWVHKDSLEQIPYSDIEDSEGFQDRVLV